MLDSLGNPPNGANNYQWADYIELRALLDIDKNFTRSQFENVMGPQASNKLVQESIRKSPELYWKDWMNFIARRKSHIFKDSYPFSVSEEKDTVYFDGCDDNPLKEIYIALLLCANIKYIPSTAGEDFNRASVTSLFEKISLPVFTSIMPKNAEIRPFWASNKRPSPYTGTLPNKLRSLAKDIKATTNFDDDDFSANDTGDGGIDIVAWHSLEDERDAIPISFAQCGCTQKSWAAKQLEASPSSGLGNMLQTTHPWSTYYLLPQDLRKTDDRWAHKNKIGKVIFVDRMRILRLIDRNQLIAEVDIPQYIKDVINSSFTEDQIES